MREQSGSGWIRVVLFALLASVFIYLTVKVVQGNVFIFDDDVFQWVHGHESASITSFAVGITFLGSQVFLLPANIILGGLFLFSNKNRAYVWKIAAVSLTSSGFLFLIKYIVRRPRPDTPLLDPALHYSFPSGHTFTSITFFGIVIYFVYKYVKSPLIRMVATVIGFLLVIAVAWSRVYLKVHYASDVLAGFCLGFMWLIMASWFFIKRNTRENQMPM